MSERRPLPRGNARQIIDYNSVISEIGTYGVYCIDKGVLRSIRHLISTRGLWRTSYVVSYGNDFYNIPDIAEFDTIDAAISGFLGGTDMCNDLTDAINNLSTIVGSGGCCGDGSGGHSPDEALSDFEDDGESFPDGYDNYSEYDEDKCNASQWFINSILQDLSLTKTLNYGTVTAAGLGLLLLIPGVNTAVLLGMLLAALAAGVLVTIIEAIEDWINDNNDDILCDIYSAVSAASAMAAIQARIDGSSLTLLEKAMLDNYITTAAINQAFQLSNNPDTFADCSECGCQDVGMVVGSFDGIDEFTSSAHPTLSDQFIQVQFEVLTIGTHSYCNTCTLNGITIDAGAPSGGGGGMAYRLVDSSGAQIYNANTLPSFPVSDVSQVTIADRTAPSNQIIATIDWSVD